MSKVTVMSKLKTADKRKPARDKQAGVQDLDTAPAEEDLIAFEEGDRPLPAGCKIIKEWRF